MMAVRTRRASVIAAVVQRLNGAVDDEGDRQHSCTYPKSRPFLGADDESVGGGGRTRSMLLCSNWVGFAKPQKLPAQCCDARPDCAGLKATIAAAGTMIAPFGRREPPVSFTDRSDEIVVRKR